MAIVANKNAEKAALRRRFRAIRRGLSDRQQAANATELQRVLLRTTLLYRYQRFAIYLPADGEIGTHPIITKLWEYSKQTALPCLRRNGIDTDTKKSALRMHFAPYAAQTLLRHGAYNLPEPVTAKQPPSFRADVILLPLVAFDRTGTRLGMGGGFYDRHIGQNANRHALRVGLAHSLQEANNPLPREPWDSTLDAVITEREVLMFNTRAKALMLPRAT